MSKIFDFGDFIFEYSGPARFYEKPSTRLKKLLPKKFNEWLKKKKSEKSKEK